LLGREIAEVLQQSGVNVTKQNVNSMLYSELSSKKCVVQDTSSDRWSVTGQPLPLEIPVATAEPGYDHGTSDGNSISTPQSKPEECRTARRVIQILRSGTTSCRAAKEVSVGTARIEKDLYVQTKSLFEDGTKGDMIVIAADWGFGKSHMRMLLSNHLSEQGLPFVHECIDARAASLAHIHRSVPRWLERLRIGHSTGLRDALSNGHLPMDRVVQWAVKSDSQFASGLYAALNGCEWGWLLALGHFYRSPDYPYQHPKAWALLESVAGFLNKMDRGGLVLLLDEAENVTRQYDIRGRRKSYETLTRMMRHPHILPVLFATDRLSHQVEEDYAFGQGRGWKNWTTEAMWFVSRFREIVPIKPPSLNDRLAEELVTRIHSIYQTGYPSGAALAPESILEHWRRTPTRSIRLLVRLTVNELDLLAQNGCEQSVDCAPSLTPANS
jgi:hypothetical protein